MSTLRILFAVLLIMGCATVCAQETDSSLLQYAVSINQTATKSRSGTGIYLGKGLVLTASHVVGGTLIHTPFVTIGGLELPARVLKQDSFENSDLALLAIDEDRLPPDLRLHRVVLCEAPPWPGQDVLTVIPEESVHTKVLSPVWLPISVRRFDTVISDVTRTGNSGSGVFDAQKKCLLGIMSRKISQIRTRDNGDRETNDIAKYFVPVSKILDFLPAEYRF